LATQEPPVIADTIDVIAMATYSGPTTQKVFLSILRSEIKL
jgi:hypothetical protein